MPLKLDWSDSEEGKDTNEQNKDEEGIEYCGSDLQKHKGLKEHELKNNNNKNPQSSPESTSTSTSISDMETLTQQLFQSLVD